MEQRLDNSVFVVSTHDSTHNGWVHHWENFPYNKEWLYHNEEGKGKGLVYTEKEMCDTLGFSGGVSKRHYWNSFGNRNIVWFYAHFRMLYYYVQNPNKDWYWFFDDDVTCDDWEGFINSFKDVQTDFISWLVFSKEDYNNGIPKIDKDTTSEHMWFERFPGDGDALPLYTQQWFGSFFPVVRFSNHSLKWLLEQFKDGFSGYSEGFVPTMLNARGYSLGSIFNKDGTSSYYDVNKIKLKHKHQDIGWNWI